jgi:TPM domain
VVVAVSEAVAPRGAGEPMSIGRIIRHMLTTQWIARRRFSPGVLTDVEQAIKEVESRHAGEIRFAVERGLELPLLLRGLTPRQRALQIFGQLGVWDTEANNGVLIYVLLADRDVEILADRGIARVVPQSDWEAICREMEQHYRAGRYAEGSIAGVRGVGRLLERHFPGGRPDADELPNQPILL